MFCNFKDFSMWQFLKTILLQKQQIYQVPTFAENVTSVPAVLHSEAFSATLVSSSPFLWLNFNYAARTVIKIW